jgi:hypothetical protein
MPPSEALGQRQVNFVNISETLKQMPAQGKGLLLSSIDAFLHNSTSCSIMDRGKCLSENSGPGNRPDTDSNFLISFSLLFVEIFGCWRMKLNSVSLSLSNKLNSYPGSNSSLIFNWV